jgi:hypothetical protein
VRGGAISYLERVEQMGDRYGGSRIDISGDQPRIGAVGDHGHGAVEGGQVHHEDYSQRWDQAQDIDLPQLAGELAALRAELRKQATEPEQDEIVAEIGRAEKAAKSNDGSKTFEHLANTGKWALNTATTIGATVAAAAIRAALGLP